MDYDRYDAQATKSGFARTAGEPVFGGSASGGIVYRPQPEMEGDVMRTFPDLWRRASIAQEAASASFNELSEMMSRLGIPRQNGQAICGDEVGPEPCGEVDGLTRAIDRLTDTVRDIRGLAETLNSRL